jgi:LacI family transcriptional regulator
MIMKNNYRKIITLKDVAQKTGFSINTVSRTLRGKDDISEETMKIIKTTADEMGYINNSLASSLRSGRSNTIAVILGDISNPHFSILTKEIENLSRQERYGVFLLNTNENEKQEKEAINTAITKNVDGIIICPNQKSDANICFLMDRKIPFVQMGRRFDTLNIPFVICNDELGGYQATKYLLEKNHRDILILTGPSYVSSARERLAGYKRAFAEQGLRVKSRLIREVPIIGKGYLKVLDSVIKEKIPFTAIFAFSDMLAWGAWTHLQRLGIRVPQDVSIIGFDYIQSRFDIPFQLSTISSYKAKMGAFAIKALFRVIRGADSDAAEKDPLLHYVIDTRLIDGETVQSL